MWRFWCCRQVILITVWTKVRNTVSRASHHGQIGGTNRANDCGQFAGIGNLSGISIRCIQWRILTCTWGKNWQGRSWGQGKSVPWWDGDGNTGWERDLSEAKVGERKEQRATKLMKKPPWLVQKRSSPQRSCKRRKRSNWLVAEDARFRKILHVGVRLVPSKVFESCVHFDRKLHSKTWSEVYTCLRVRLLGPKRATSSTKVRSQNLSCSYVWPHRYRSEFTHWKNSSWSITQLLSRPKVSKIHFAIS